MRNAPSFNIKPLNLIDPFDIPLMTSIESSEIIKTDIKPPIHSLAGTQATKSSKYKSQP